MRSANFSKLHAGLAPALIICKITLAMVMIHPNMQTPPRPGLVGQSRRSTNIHVGVKRTTATGGSIRTAAVEASRFVQKKSAAKLQLWGPFAVSPPDADG